MIPLIFGMILGVRTLPENMGEAPVSCPHFPDRAHAFVWRNWQLVPADRLAAVLGASEDDVVQMGGRMGLTGRPAVTPDQRQRSYITVIRRNWHLLPYAQLLEVLEWTEEQLAYTLREDDFLFGKLGGAKPRCEPVRYTAPDVAVLEREQMIARIVREEFPAGAGGVQEPLFGFVDDLSAPCTARRRTARVPNRFSPRFCYSYFALYGDALIETDVDSYPDGYLARLAASGVSGIWLQGVLYKLAPFPWDTTLSQDHEKRLATLRALVQRARRHGLGVYLYLNEPRAMPLAFYESLPDLRGVVEQDYAALCTSAPEVQAYITDAIASICSAVPDLAGLFTITASENLSNCWSHGSGAGCPRCGARSPSDVIAEVNALIKRGIDRSGTDVELIVWDWGWRDDWALDAIGALPDGVSLMSVSEWSIPIRRGGIESVVGEYSISAVGPGPRATRHWEAARARGLKTLAKIQAGNTWELSAVPYIPAVANVAQHAANLRDAGVDGLMLGWTLGGYPSPNLGVVAEIGSAKTRITVEQALRRTAARRFGADLAAPVAEAWQRFSASFGEFPFHIGLVYTAPLQVGPANPLWETPTGYRATMVGFPYDDLDTWRSVYPPDVFVGQLTKVADGFESTLDDLRARVGSEPGSQPGYKHAFQQELRVAEAAAIHFRSAANQARFVLARRALAAAASLDHAQPALEELGEILRSELVLAKRLYDLQIRDSRIGFEASNQYYYVPLDLVEKVVNCRDLLDRWLPDQRARFHQAAEPG